VKTALPSSVQLKKRRKKMLFQAKAHAHAGLPFGSFSQNNCHKKISIYLKFVTSLDTSME
jgi:hypothetical protein